MSTDFSDSEDVHGLHGRMKFKKAVRVQGEAGAWMDMERRKLQAYEYLCHVGEAKDWIEAVSKEHLPPIDQLEEAMRNGIILAKLAKAFDSTLSGRKIFEDTSKLQYRHSDNINMIFSAMRNVGLPDLFIFELTDLYDKKNIPKVIYCIHALSHLLAKKGLAPHIKNLLGQLSFTDEQLDKTNESLDAAAVPMPAFGNIQNALAKELDEPSDEEKRLQFLKDNERKIIAAQAFWRGALCRKSYNERLNNLKSHEELWSKLQARYRGKKDRSNYLNKLNHWKNSQDAITKIQALWRARQAEKAYKALCSIKDANMKVLQNFLFLLEDGDFDYEEDLELEQLRQLVIMKIRENIVTESDVNNLDLKIALLVKNRITLEEVVHFTTKQMKSMLSSSESLTERDATGNFNLKGTDRENRKRKLHYEQLFYLLQTQPHYLTKLMYLMNQKSGASVTRFLEQTVLTLYGYAQNSREEYLLLNLIDSAIQLEISYLSKLDDFWRDNPLFIKLVLQYIRGAKERLYLRELLQPLIKKVLKNKSLELELDPLTIYKSLIKQEESRTGEKSSRSHDVTAAQAATDADVKSVQLANLASLKGITEDFLRAIITSVKKMPYGIRYIAMRMKDHMLKKFPEGEDEINKIVGNLIYYRYINPAIVAPEAFDVIESNISPLQRKNLAEIAKTLHHISTGKSVAGVEAHHAQLNEFIKHSSTAFSAYLNEVDSVVPADEFFDMNEFVDSSRQSKPKIYISPEEICQVHRNLDLYLDELATKEEDPLKVILSELGAVPPAGYGSKQAGSEIALELKDRFAKVGDDGRKEIRKLIKETKRFVIAILHVQTGSSLLETLEIPVTSKEESAFAEYVEAELIRANERAEQQQSLGEKAQSTNTLSGSRQELSPAISSPFSLASLHLGYAVQSLFVNADGSKMSFSQLKKRTLENMAKLEDFGEATKENKYQDLLNSLTEDILNKHRRRNRRQKELETLRKTLDSLEEKYKYLSDQKQSYDDYIHSCMAQLGNKKGKQKRIMPFTRQYYHMRELNKQGKVPQFGSYKYSAAELHKKGVLIGIDEYEPKQYGQITLTISSDEAGTFTIEAAFLGVKLPDKMELRLEDLLTAQDNNESVITLFDGAHVNLNLLIFLLNKKFFG